MTLKDLMIASSGTDEHKMPKCSVVIMNEFWDVDGNKEEIDEIVVETPIAQFFAGDGFITLDLDFGSRLNVDLDMVNDALMSFRTAANSIDDDKMPVTTVVIVPSDYEGQYFIACINPVIHCLTANKPNADLSIIRMVFTEESCSMYENEDYVPESDEEVEED
ncbi:MAG: hypothetical protein UIM53_03225 [Acutalibacteraceae bacterium]|nr:hypothetical protein [Acutalibacteraceae bacterium]